MITSYIWKREKFPHSDWLREMQFSGKIIPRRGNQFSSYIYDKQFSRNKRKEYQKIITCLNRVALTKCSLVFWEFIWIISALLCFCILIVRCFLIFFPWKTSEYLLNVSNWICPTGSYSLAGYLENSCCLSIPYCTRKYVITFSQRAAM